MKKCKDCNSRLLSLYYRENKKDFRKWVKITEIYCRNCKTLEQPQEE